MCGKPSVASRSKGPRSNGAGVYDTRSGFRVCGLVRRRLVARSSADALGTDQVCADVDPTYARLHGRHPVTIVGSLVPPRATSLPLGAVSETPLECFCRPLECPYRPVIPTLQGARPASSRRNELAATGLAEAI